MMESPICRFRRRSLQSNPTQLNTGWEDILVPQGMALAGSACNDDELVDWSRRWFEHHRSGGIRKEEASRVISSLEPLTGHLIGDYCGNWAGTLVFWALNQVQPDPRFRDDAREIAEAVLQSAIRLPGGVFAHGGWDHGRRTIWVDTMYYTVPVLASAWSLTGKEAFLEEATRQALLHSEALSDPSTGCFFHDCEPATGIRSSALWARCNGWAILSLADILRILPPTHADRSTLLETYRRLSTGILRFQQHCGLWRIVPENPDSHMETSGSAMILTGLAAGLHEGWLDPGIRGAIRKGWCELESWIDVHGALQGAQRPAGCGGWDTHKLSTLGECTYANGLLWRLVAELVTAGIVPASAIRPQS